MDFLCTIDDGYIEPIKNLLYSIYVNNGGEHRFYFLFINICEENRKEVVEFAKNKCKSEAVFVEYLNDMLNVMPAEGAWSKEIYLRLFAPYVLNNIDKILYLDGDTIVNGNIRELFFLENFSNYFVAAIPNDVQESHKLRLGLGEECTYINSGVMLMNLEKIRNVFSIEDIEMLLTKLRKRLVFPDQDFINIVFKDNIKLLDVKYNYMISLSERTDSYPKLKDFKICHYVLAKPWNEEFPYKTDTIYFKYLLKRKQFKRYFYLLYKHRKTRLVYKIKKQG